MKRILYVFLAVSAISISSCSLIGVAPHDDLFPLENDFEDGTATFVKSYNTHGGYRSEDSTTFQESMLGSVSAVNQQNIDDYLNKKGDKEKNYDLETENFLNINEDYKDTHFEQFRRNYKNHFSEAMQFFAEQNADNKYDLTRFKLDSLTQIDMIVAVADFTEGYATSGNFHKEAPIAKAGATTKH